ncbi:MULTISPECIES: trans-aconitate 2-methyltransferase [Nocardia]|uniref:trans-aconitate 2-methyltransferase n=1 Tax=Nocardia TaxID=1817 RepID=UPI0007E9ADCA|nr:MULTISPECIES: trans-aconitate 2-methyltransferase [Nocardia]MBF6277951.1 trans-aconitate 2-methyltransferase [Nocardia nova]OBA47399.1 trans-aconitate methyltransferase [Nocardia sp. 852002-51101_SCH5132738]OBB44716.1 trans-aconitate methyltransferase [Nocardia sp. 852002-51244_SCH5132740]OBF77550.1 trans-aconitate methyltransferase [Mycobacterium sp. 852002-51759_SCH5129042]
MWDPEKYRSFGDHRSRPFFELIARIDAENPRRVVDLGCGPGQLTGVLAQRWPKARIDAFDSSPEMVAAARESGIDAEVRSAEEWQPAPDTDVVVTNAVLQWVPTHTELLPRWVAALPAGAWLALQVPGNFDAPSHVAIRELAAREEWRPRLEASGILQPRDVLDPSGYARLLTAAGCTVNAWETTYLQRLTGNDPVLEWVTGTALRPVRSALDDDAWTEFTAQLAPLLRAAYPQRADGTTWLPFRRVFAVAHKSGD